MTIAIARDDKIFDSSRTYKNFKGIRSIRQFVVIILSLTAPGVGAVRSAWSIVE